MFCGEHRTNRIKASMVNVNKISHNINGICEALGKIRLKKTKRGNLSWYGEKIKQYREKHSIM
jgi:hypothetical protein